MCCVSVEVLAALGKRYVSGLAPYLSLVQTGPAGTGKKSFRGFGG